jgi:hypothetical protein
MPMRNRRRAFTLATGAPAVLAIDGGNSKTDVALVAGAASRLRSSFES